jgi:hypothetical protein
MVGVEVEVYDRDGSSACMARVIVAVHGRFGSSHV